MEARKESKSSIARKMLLAGASYQEVCEYTGLSINSARGVAWVMRKAGIKIPLKQPRYKYTGKNDLGQVVKFSSLSECEKNNFNGALISLCVNGLRESHAGYKWTRRKVR